MHGASACRVVNFVAKGEVTSTALGVVPSGGVVTP